MSKSAPYILFADDDPDDRDMLAQLFLSQNPDARFEYVKDGLEALEFLEQRHSTDLPDIILLDYKMPRLSGAEFLRTIQAKTRFQHIPKVVWSTSGNPDFVRNCLTCGAIRYFTKPNGMSELDNIVTYLNNLYQTKD